MVHSIHVQNFCQTKSVNSYTLPSKAVEQLLAGCANKIIWLDHLDVFLHNTQNVKKYLNLFQFLRVRLLVGPAQRFRAVFSPNRPLFCYLHCYLGKCRATPFQSRMWSLFLYFYLNRFSF